jgi:hypothetical protein
VDLSRPIGQIILVPKMNLGIVLEPVVLTNVNGRSLALLTSISPLHVLMMTAIHCTQSALETHLFVELIPLLSLFVPVIARDIVIY